MKILKVKARREQTSRGTHYTYPPEYDARKIQVLCYESSLPENYDKVVVRGNKDEFLIGVVDDVDASVFLTSPDIKEITKTEAMSLGEQWTKQAQKVTDEKKVLLIVAKAARGEQLTQEDKKALDPADPEQGVNLSRSFTDVLNELEQKWL